MGQQWETAAKEGCNGVFGGSLWREARTQRGLGGGRRTMHCRPPLARPLCCGAYRKYSTAVYSPKEGEENSEAIKEHSSKIKKKLSIF